MRRPLLASPLTRIAALGVASALALAACGAASGTTGGASSGASTDPALTVAPPASFAPTTITLLAHDSFAVSKDVLAAFEARTGITVKVVTPAQWTAYTAKLQGT